MELSERCIQALEKEGFTYVYETQDAPEAIYEEHQHQDKVAVFVTEGSFEITVGGQTKNLSAGDRFNIPPRVPYSAVVGKHGCQLVIGEMIDGDF
jgi:quercetin dioxygenase-like cupin family protein